MLVRYEAGGVLVGRNVSAQVVIRPCGHLLSYLHAHDNLGLTTCRSCRMILCSLPKSPLQKHVSFCDTLDSEFTVQTAALLPIWSSWLWARIPWNFYLPRHNRQSQSYSTDICCTQERAHSSPLPHSPPLILVGLNSGPWHHLWKS